MELVRQAIATLATTRPIFHSEADFQHALALAIQVAEPNAEIRLEVPAHSDDGRRYLDVVVRTADLQIGIELKYKTRRLLAETAGEMFLLENQSAQDLGRYDYFKDINRLEHFVRASPNRTGVAALLTNDSAYWNPPGRTTVGYAEFAMTDGRLVSGELTWKEGAGEGTRKNRVSPIALAGRYELKWKEYSRVECRLPQALGGGHGRFRYVVAEVGHPDKRREL